MKQSLIMLCLLGLSFAGGAQDKNFDLSKYKFPDYKRHELELNFRSSGQSIDYSQKDLSYTGNGNPTTSHSSNSYFNSNFRLGYQYDHLTRKRIDHVYSTLAGEYDYSRNNDNGVVSKLYKPNIEIVFDGFRRYYLNENRFFLEGLTNLQYYFDESKTKSSNGNWSERNRQNYFTISGGLGGGVGRMEKVSDLWQSNYILEKLKQQKSLSRELEETDIFEFASIASKLKNKRFFDVRLRKISELQSLDSLLHKQGLIKDTDIAYFTTLNDYWSYGNFQDRESGRILKIWLSPEYSRSYNKPNVGSSEMFDKTSFVSTITFNCSKQLNLFWERYFNSRISNETVIDKSGKQYTSYPSNFFSSNVNFGYGFFPDSRTSIFGHLGYSGQNLIVLNASSNIPDQWMNRVYLAFMGHYYISPQLQITGSFNLSYYDKNYNATNQIYTEYSLGLRYAIF